MESPETFYVTYPGQQRIVKVAPDATVSVFAGAKGPGRYQRDAVLPWPGAIALDKRGNLLVATDYRIRLVEKNGAVTTLLRAEPRPPGPEMYEPPKTSVEFNPGALLVDPNGILYIADTIRHPRASDGFARQADGGLPDSIFPQRQKADLRGWRGICIPGASRSAPMVRSLSPILE